MQEELLVYGTGPNGSSSREKEGEEGEGCNVVGYRSLLPVRYCGRCSCFLVGCVCDNRTDKFGELLVDYYTLREDGGTHQ